MSAETRAAIGEYLAGQITVVEDRAVFNLVEAFVAQAAEKEELRRQRDQARRGMASLEAEVAKVRTMHRQVPNPWFPDEGECESCYVPWPCKTAEAVYLTGGDL